MKNFVKVLPIALLVLAICMTSVSVAAVTATYADSVVSVTTDEGNGDVTIIATRQDGSAEDAVVSEAAAWDNIVYIDQAAAGTTFNFVPERADVTGYKVTAFIGKTGGSVVETAEANLIDITTDSGYVAESAGAAEKTGAISVTAALKENSATIKEVGFWVYRPETAEASIVKYGEESADSIFYTVLYGVPAADFDEDILVKPYVTVVINGEDVTEFGAIKTCSVNAEYKGEGELQYIGTESQLEAALAVLEN